MKIRVGIADDHQYDIDIAKVVMEQLLYLPEFRGVEFEFLEFLDPTKEVITNTREIDIMIVDVKMSHINGGEIAELLNEYQPDCQIIFVTNDSSFAIKGYRYNVAGFVVKPINLVNIDDYFVSALRDAVGSGEITVERNYISKSIRVSEVVYIKSAKNGSLIFTADESHLVCKFSVKQLAETYKKEFFKIDGGTLINLKYYKRHARKIRKVYLTHSDQLEHAMSISATKNIDDALFVYRHPGVRY